MAFGQNMIERTIETRLFRKVSPQNMFRAGEVIFSTEKYSTKLIGRGDMCLVLELDKYEGLWYDGDADNGRNFGYDEFRVEINKIDLFSKLEYIVVPNSWVDSELDPTDDNYDLTKDPQEWIENLSEVGIVIAERDFDGKIDFNF